jgi:phosphopantetheine--protein transferase-like protein
MTEDQLRELVSTIAQIGDTEITPSTPLTGPLGGSLGRARLDAAIRSKTGISDAGIYKLKTFGDLCALFGIENSSQATQNGSVAAATKNRGDAPIVLADGINIGTDIEAITAVPETADYWEDSFYKEIFTPREIAYSLLQPSPRASFAAIWCAKEAARKANAGLASAPWSWLEVVHDGNGKPHLEVDGKPLGGALSLSHTNELALATYASIQLPQSPEAAPPPAPSPIPREPLPSVASGKTCLILSTIAVLVAIAAFVAALVRR